MWASERMKPVLLALALLGTAPALAQTPLTAEEFDTIVTGNTITYSQSGGIFGIEEYLPKRQVRWSVAENLCQYGVWYPEGEAICFVYEDEPTPHCWTFWLDSGRLKALSVNDLPGAELTEVERTQTPLSCPGPDIGV
jgi:hypothetical protein